MLLERGTASSSRSSSDRGCPLSTAVVRLMWHVGGTSHGMPALTYDAVGSYICSIKGRIG